jgi:hypothetical protein
MPEFYFINSLDCGEYVKDLQAGGIPGCQPEDKKNNKFPSWRYPKTSNFMPTDKKRFYTLICQICRKVKQQL